MRYGMRNPFTRHDVMMWTALCMITACAPTHVDQTREYTGKAPLPKPDRVLIYDFAVSEKDIKLNTGIGARLANMATGANENEEQVKVGKAVAKALSESLVKELNSLGLPVERATPGTRLNDKTVAIHGQFLTIDEGNRARRMVIGFGLGGTEVRTKVQVFQGPEPTPALLEEFETQAESSKKPGMGPMAGVGVAATGAASSAAVAGGVGAATEFNQTVEGDAKRTAKEIAKPLSRFFASQGWIGPEKIIK